MTAPGPESLVDRLKSAQPFLPDFLTVCVYVVLGFFLTVLVLTNFPVLALLFTFLVAIGHHLLRVVARETQRVAVS